MSTWQLHASTGASEQRYDIEADNSTANQGTTFRFCCNWTVSCLRHSHASSAVIVIVGGSVCILKGSHVWLLQGELGTRGADQEGGKENVNPGRKPKLPRQPRVKKAAAADGDPTHCTQIPITLQPATSLKRTLKQGQQLACAEDVETQPRTPRTSRSKKLAEAAFEVVDFLVQTPMPGTGGGNDLGPPHPETTPTPQRKSHISRYAPAFSILELHCLLLHELCSRVLLPDCCAGGLRAPGARRTREEKGKVVRSKPRRPRAWVPPTILPNLTDGVHTRALAAQVVEYEQQRMNDDTICDVLADVWRV